MNKPKRILIVDDEPLARQRLSRYLKQSGLSLLVEAAATGLEAVERIREFEPDIVFLDVEMPGLSGFEVLQQFDERPFHVVFQTAYDEFAVRAFEEHACDYLLKPFTPKRFLESLDHALGRVTDHERLRALEATMAEHDGYLRRLSVKQGSRLRIVEDKDISCIVSRDHCTCVYFEGAHEAITDLSIARLTERLDPAVFKQLHRNNIVRVTEIVSLSTHRNGSMHIELRNGMKLPVSRSRRRHARELVKALGM